MRDRKPFRIPKSQKDELYLQPQAMIEINIEAVAGVAEPHKEVAVAKLHEEVDLVKAQNTVQVIVVGNQEEVAPERSSSRRSSPRRHSRRSRSLSRSDGIIYLLIKILLITLLINFYNRNQINSNNVELFNRRSP